MSLDATPEWLAMRARLRENLFGGDSGRVHDPVPEESQLATDQNNFILPYVVLWPGVVVPLYGDRTIEGEAQQPHTLPWVVECWATTFDQAVRTAGAVRTLFTGWEPTENSSEITLRGGSPFWQRDASTGRPSRFLMTVTGEVGINMSVDVSS